MSALRTTFSDIKLKQNNKRALAIHFCLTLIGLPLAFFIGAIGANHDLSFLAFDSAMGIVPFVVTLVIGPLAYIACGYVYLKPTKHKERLSLLWLTCVTVGWSLLTSIVLSGLWLAELGLIGDDSPLWMLGILYMPLTPLVNAIGFGLMWTLVGVLEVIEPSFHLLGSLITLPLMLLITSIVPPGLLYLGMRLKQRYPNLIKSAEPSQSKTGNKEEDGQDWSNSACENFNWENEAK